MDASCASTERGAAVIALDVGGTTIKGALETRDGVVHHRTEVPTPAHSGTESLLAVIGSMVEDLRPAPGDPLGAVAVGVVVPGPVDATTGVARYSANIGWRDLPLRDLVSARVGLPVAVDHDVRAAGLAEARLGAARGVEEALFVSIGTGIAAAAITRGRVVSGARGMAGEIGHVPVYPDGERCACGQRGCSETYASAAALARRYVAQGGSGPVTAEHVIALARGADAIATRVYEEALVALARTLVSYVLMMDPGLVVIGGGLARAGEALVEPLAARVAGGLSWREPPPIVVSALESDAGRRGAAIVAWDAWDAEA